MVMKQEKEAWFKLLITGIVGTIIVAICCFAPYFVMILTLIGLSFFTPYLDYILFPLLLFFIMLTIISFLKWRRLSKKKNMKKAICPLCKSAPCVCDTSKYKNDINFIGAEEVKEKMKQSEVVVINVLNKEYFEDCHIKESIGIPLNELKGKADLLDRNKEIIVHCANYMCTASSAAYKLLREMGFKKILAFEGGMKEWKDKSYSVEGSCILDYLK